MLLRPRLLSAVAALGVGLGLSLSASLPASAQARDWSRTAMDWSQEVEGNGQVTSEIRILGAYSKLKVLGSMDVKLVQAGTPGATVTTDGNVIPYVETTVDGDTLQVRMRPDVDYDDIHDVTVELRYVSLNAISLIGSGDVQGSGLKSDMLSVALSGSGDLRLDQIQATKLDAALSGSGDLYLSGSAEQARYSLAGSGDVHAQDLAAGQCRVSIAGSGDARVQAVQRLDASVAGSGDVRYAGNPADVRRSVAGSGDVRPMH